MDFFSVSCTLVSISINTSQLAHFLLPVIVWPPLAWPSLLLIPLPEDDAKDKSEDYETEEDFHGDVSGLWQYNDPDLNRTNHLSVFDV